MLKRNILKQIGYDCTAKGQIHHSEPSRNTNLAEHLTIFQKKRKDEADNCRHTRLNGWQYFRPDIGYMLWTVGNGRCIGNRAEQGQQLTDSKAEASLASA